MNFFLCQLVIGSIYWQIVAAKLHLTNDIIEDKLSPQLFKVVHRKDDHFSHSLYQNHLGPRSDWNDTIVRWDLSRQALNEFILDKIENVSKYLTKLDQLAIDASNIDLINEIALSDRRNYLSALTDMTSFFTSSFTCAKNERQFSFIQNNTARVCCNNRSGATRSCKSHRCLGDLAADTPHEQEGKLKGLTSKGCCRSKKNLRFCPGSLTETVDVGTGALGSCANKNAFINVRSSTARVCCVSSSVCSSLFPCMKIVQRTSVKNSDNRFLCCQSYVNRFFYCSSQSTSGQSVVQPTSTTPSYGGPVNPGYYGRPPPPPPPPPVQPPPPNPPSVYPPPQPQPQPYVPYVRPVRVCQYSRTDLADAFANVTQIFTRVSKSLHSLRDKFALESPQIVAKLNATQFSEISNRIVSKISQFKEKQAIIRSSNKRLLRRQ